MHVDLLGMYNSIVFSSSTMCILGLENYIMHNVTCCNIGKWHPTFMQCLQYWKPKNPPIQIGTNLVTKGTVQTCRYEGESYNSHGDNFASFHLEKISG